MSIENKPYSRSFFPHWGRTQRQSISTRQFVLDRDSLVKVAWKNSEIVQGVWSCLYTGRVITTPSRLDIDHVVSLRECWYMGGRSWGENRRQIFANDPDNLIAVYRSSNRSKKSDSISQGMPPNVAGWGRYIAIRRAVFDKYGLMQPPYEQQLEKRMVKFWTANKSWLQMDQIDLANVYRER